jgi:hypothetical protein
MDPLLVLSRLVAAGPRRACTDAERRAATWARDELRDRGHTAGIETHWVRPSWEFSYALHTALGAAGSLLSVWQPEAALAILVAAGVSLAGELTGRLRVLRLVGPPRATQNVVVDPAPTGRLRLMITANLDSGPPTALSGDRWLTFEARLRLALHGNLPPPVAWLLAMFVLLALIAGLRIGGPVPQAVAALQFGLTLIMVVASAGFVDAALTDAVPGANVNASGVGVAMALADELRANQLAALDVELVLTGAGDRQNLGLERHIRSRRRNTRPEDVIVLAIGPSGSGRPIWLERDGQLLPLRTHPRLCALMADTADAEAHLRARPHRAWGDSGAYLARRLGWPAIAVGSLDDRGLVARAHQPADVPEVVDRSSIEAVLELCLAFVGRLDAELTTLRAGAPPGDAPPAGAHGHRAGEPEPGETGAARA